MEDQNYFVVVTILILLLLCLLGIVAILTYLWVTFNNNTTANYEMNGNNYYEWQQLIETNENIARLQVLLENEHRSWPFLGQLNTVCLKSKRNFNSV